MSRWPHDPVPRVSVPPASVVSYGGNTKFSPPVGISRPAEGLGRTVRQSDGGSSNFSSAPSAQAELRSASPVPVRGFLRTSIAPSSAGTSVPATPPVEGVPLAHHFGSRQAPSATGAASIAGSSLGQMRTSGGYTSTASSFSTSSGCGWDGRRSLGAPPPQLYARIGHVDAEAGTNTPSVGGASTQTLPPPASPSSLGKALGAGTTARGGSAPSRPASQPFPASAPPFYWVTTVDTVTEFEVSGAFGEIVSKMGDFEDRNSALPIAGTLRMVKGALYFWSLQVVRLNPHRPQIQFGINGAEHARPARLVSTGRCSRSRDDGPWLARPGGDLAIVEGDYIHCEADLRGLGGPFGALSFAVNGGQMETVFEDIPLSEGPLQPVLLMGGGGTICRVCHA